MAGSRWLVVPPLCGQSATEQSSGSRCTRTGRMRSEISAYRSNTLTRRLLSLRDTERAMSQENVERIRSAFAGTTAGDFSYLPGLIDDSCEFLLPPNFPGTQATRGPGGFVSVVQEFEE